MKLFTAHHSPFAVAAARSATPRRPVPVPVLVLVLVPVLGPGSGPALADDPPPLVLPEPGPAAEKLARARRLAAEGDFPAAARGLQEVLERHARSVVPVLEDPGLHAAASEVALRELSAWPSEGIAAYRALHDPAAEDALRRGDLEEVAARYPGTAAAGRALRLLADRALEDGRAGAASDLYDRLLARLSWRAPDAGDGALLAPAAARAVLLRAVRAAAEARLPERASALARLAERRIEWRPLAGALRAAAEAAARAAREGPPPRDWPRLGGEPGRNLPAAPEPPAAAPGNWRATLPPPPGLAGDYFDGGAFSGRGEVLRRRACPIHPVVADGTVYVTDGRTVDSYELYTGKAARRRLLDTGAARFRGDRFEPTRLHALEVAGPDLVLAVELPPSPDDTPHNFAGVLISEPIPRRKLVALSRETGRVRWEALAREDGLGPLDSLSAVSAPLVDGDRVYVVGRKGEGGLARLFAIALDRRTGAPVWHTYLCAGGGELNMFGRPVRETVVSPPALAGGLLAICTNLGAVAVVEADRGGLRWVRTYPATSLPVNEGFHVRKRPPTWETNPPVVAGDLVLAAPTDCERLLALDRRTGALRWTLERTRDRGDYRHLLGARGGLAIVTGRRAAGVRLDSGEVAWVAPDLSEREPDDPPGRGLLTRGSVWWPGCAELRRLDLATGEILDRRPWDEIGSSPGNLVSVNGVLLVASASEGPGLCAVMDRDEVVASLEERARTSPADPEPLLAAAEVRMQAREMPAARATLERAAARAGALPPGPARAGALLRVRGALHALALRECDAAAPVGSPGALAALARALESAPDDAARVRTLRLLAEHRLASGDAARYRATLREIADRHADVPLAFRAGAVVPAGFEALWLLAHHLEAEGRAEEVVEACQEILARFPDAPSPEGDAGATAAAWAREKVAAILARGGRGPYRRHDEAARALLEGTRPGEEEAVFRTLLARYPNAACLPEGVLRLADALRASGRAEAAADALRGFLREAAGAPPVRAAAGLLLARCYEDSGKWAAARAVLERLARESGTIRIPGADGGAPREAGEIVRERLSRAEYAAAAAPSPDPELRTPLREAFRLRLPAGARLYEARPRPPLGAEHLLLVSVPGALEGRDGRTGEGLWRAPISGGRILDVAAGERLLLVTTPGRLTGVRPEDGRVSWTRELPRDARVGAVRGAVVAAGPDPRVRGSSLVATYEEATGQPVWDPPVRVRGETLPFPMGRGDALVLMAMTSDEDPPRASGFVHVLDLLTGTLRASHPVENCGIETDVAPLFIPRAPGDPRAPSDAGVALLVAPDRTSVRATDPASGGEIWKRGLRNGRILPPIGIGEETLVLTLESASPATGSALGLLGLAARTGAVAWSLPDFRGLVGPPEVAGEDFFCLRADPDATPDPELRLEAYKAATAALRWRGSLGDPRADVSRVFPCRRAIAVLLTRARRGGPLTVSLLAFDRATGKRAQEPLVPDLEFSEPPKAVLVPSGTIVLQSGDTIVGYRGD
ncbi:MAG: PQQ-binding-like beta-propeller repeat protein [Planctomycetales bacterium]|nr:PQQ-binding-like beta-propeller repeat protein [Planctomycetales bacterium]